MTNTTYTTSNGYTFTVDQIKRSFGEFLADDSDWNNPEFRAIADSIMADCNVNLTAEDIRGFILDGGYYTFIVWGHGYDVYDKEVKVYLSDSTYVTEDNKLVARFSYDDFDYSETYYNENGKVYLTDSEVID